MDSLLNGPLNGAFRAAGLRICVATAAFCASNYQICVSAAAFRMAAFRIYDLQICVAAFRAANPLNCFILAPGGPLSYVLGLRFTSPSVRVIDILF